jgi:anti-sigma regulatory factor (Ser/Thr protein kinase)
MVEPFNFNIDLPVRSEWQNVDLLRSSVQNCLTTILSDQDGCHAIAMIVAELLENAIKHGTWKSEIAPAFRLHVYRIWL